MRIEVRASRGSLTPQLTSYVKRRLTFAIGNHFDKVRRVLVTMRDINGPKGGLDQRCQILIRLDGQPDLVIEDTQRDWPAAVDCAAARASHTLRRRFDRQERREKRADAWLPVTWVA